VTPAGYEGLNGRLPRVVRDLLAVGTREGYWLPKESPVAALSALSRDCCGVFLVEGANAVGVTANQLVRLRRTE